MSNDFGKKIPWFLFQIHREIRNLAAAHSSVASIFSLGKSHENRDQLAIKVNNIEIYQNVWDCCVPTGREETKNHRS